MKDIRWKQRFENFKLAFDTFNETLTAYSTDRKNIVYKLALIQAFEFTYELGWNLMKDYMELQGLADFEKSPRGVIKEAFNIEIIKNGEAWSDMIDTRNVLSHAYNEEKADIAIEKISNVYSKEFENLLLYFQGRL